MAISIKKKGSLSKPLPTSNLGVHTGVHAPNADETQEDATLSAPSQPSDAPATQAELGHGDAPPNEETLIERPEGTTVVESAGGVPGAIYNTGRGGRAGLQAGDVIDERYRVREPLGAGGMAQVWLAEHIAIEKSVAIKVLSPKGTSADPQGELSERFLREAKATAAIKHKGVVDITDFGRLKSGMPYFVMEHLEGATLHEQIVNHGPMHWLDARDALAELAEALSAAHARGIVHCDLKPSNIFVLGPPGHHSLKIIDFGIAKLTQASASTKNITRPGLITGTPTYMSPEQTRGRGLDARTDIYALGCIAYFLMHGRPPFEAEETGMLLKMQLFSKPRALRSLVPEVPDELEAVVTKALAKDPDDRFQSMKEMRAALIAAGDVFEDEPSVAKPYVRDDAKTLIRKLDKPLKIGTSKHPLVAGRPPPSDATTVIPDEFRHLDDKPEHADESPSTLPESSRSAASSIAHGWANPSPASSQSMSSSSLDEPASRSPSGEKDDPAIAAPAPPAPRGSPSPLPPRSAPLVPVLVVLLLVAIGAIGYLVATR